eukprot:s2780_g6.t1
MIHVVQVSLHVGGRSLQTFQRHRSPAAPAFSSLRCVDELSVRRAEGNCSCQSRWPTPSEEIGRAFRSCYPDLVLGFRKSSAVHLVEDSSFAETVDDEPELEFHDVEQFLTERGHTMDGAPASSEETFHESDIAEVLAVTWKEKRAEITRLQKARKFQQVKEAKRQFRIEVEEIKRRSKCHRCHKQGHGARERPNKPQSSSTSSPTTAGKNAYAAKSHSSGAAMVESVS